MPYKLVNTEINSDTVEAHQHLAEAARDGLVIGGATVAMLKGRKFFVSVYGAAQRDPVLMRGAVLSLDDQLRDLVHGRTDSETTR